ncbi:MAG TPA: hypothetical protein VK069_11685 [Mycolicibacillus parakoreensis]|nr:hypothetical protein [Mycolicibacillus parakoreensis]
MTPDRREGRPASAARPADGVIAGAASLLGFAGAVWYGFCAVVLGSVLVWSTWSDGWRHPWGGPNAAQSAWPLALLAVGTVVQGALVAALIRGGVLLGRRRGAGRRVLTAACAAGVGFALIWQGLNVGAVGGSDPVNLATLPVPFLLILLILVVIPPTRRWCDPGAHGPVTP